MSVRVRSLYCMWMSDYIPCWKINTSSLRNGPFLKKKLLILVRSISNHIAISIFIRALCSLYTSAFCTFNHSHIELRWLEGLSFPLFRLCFIKDRYSFPFPLLPMVNFWCDHFIWQWLSSFSLHQCTALLSLLPTLLVGGSGTVLLFFKQQYQRGFLFVFMHYLKMWLHYCQFD